jgi:DNA invertase Pin-like site-specific DNA recombinase
VSSRRAIAYLPASEDAQPDLNELQDAARLEVVAISRAHSDAERGLAGTLERIAHGEASALLVVRLADAAASARELVALLDWLAEARADLVALDVGLDTGSPAGRRTVAALREVDRWERAPAPGRPPRGRPGLAALAPDLSARIAAMRERGDSLQAIADALNADGVPTRRGGALWRPSSVQAALGYRRPRPPLPGAPPLPGSPALPGAPAPGAPPLPRRGDGAPGSPGRRPARGPERGRPAPPPPQGRRGPS